MSNKTLSDTGIRATKPTNKDIRLFDSNGLYLIIKPNNSRWWRIDYCINRKRKTLSLGTYPLTRNLFESKDYIQGIHSSPSHFWIPLLGLFTGARENELCQLYKSDVYQDVASGVWVIDINENKEDKKLKKSSHKRIVPIHKKLIDLGFIEFTESVKAERLFEDLPYLRDGYGDKFSKWFNRTYRKRCNVGQFPEEKKNFHSFRHTVITQLRNVHNIDKSVTAKLVGQQPSDQNETDRYTKKLDIVENQKIVNKLKFSVDFNKIRRFK